MSTYIDEKGRSDKLVTSEDVYHNTWLKKNVCFASLLPKQTQEEVDDECRLNIHERNHYDTTKTTFCKLPFVQDKKYNCYDYTKLPASRFRSNNDIYGAKNISGENCDGIGYFRVKKENKDISKLSHHSDKDERVRFCKGNMAFDISNLEEKLPKSFDITQTPLLILSLQRNSKVLTLLRCIHTYGDITHFLCVKGGNSVLVAFAQRESAVACCESEINAQMVSLIYS